MCPIISLNKSVNKEKTFAGAILLVLMFLSSCSTKEKVPLAVNDGRVYETKAQIRTPQETNTVKIQIALKPQKAIRLEVSGTLGVSLASVLVIPGQIKIALHTQNTFISGPFHEKTLYPLFKQNISPRLIWKIIHDQNPETKQLSCQLNEQAKPISCSHTDGTQVTWTYESDSRKRIDIKNNKFEMNWIFKDILQLPEYQNETFVLKKPDDYKEIIIK